MYCSILMFLYCLQESTFSYEILHMHSKLHMHFSKWHIFKLRDVNFEKGK
jgi:hypothetical protein